MKTLSILGSTGSIGTQTLAVTAELASEFDVKVLAAGTNVRLLAEQVKRFHPTLVALGDESQYALLKELLNGEKVEIVCGEEGVCAAASVKVDRLVHGIAGMAGLRPLLAAIRAGNTVAFANKESLVTAGPLIKEELAKYQVTMLPVDSEHSAIFQCLMGGRSALDALILTASGGPFRNYTAEQMEHITPSMALAHPTWKMGPKVTIDSATMMNKGLEVIEAHYLFDVDYDHIEVLVQPQSLVHSMVRFADGSFLAHLGRPDMRIPIQFALTYPERHSNTLEQADFGKIGKIEFQPVCRELFPLLDLAYAAGRAGGTLPAVMNAANEALVYMFLRERIQYKDIYKYTECVLAAHNNRTAPSLEDIFAAQAWARRYLDEVIQ